MTYLVICPSLQYFLRALPSHFDLRKARVLRNQGRVLLDSGHIYQYMSIRKARVLRNQGRVLLNSGHIYQYVSSVKQLRGVHGVKVIQWGWLPEWAKHEDLIHHIKHAEME